MKKILLLMLVLANMLVFSSCNNTVTSEITTDNDISETGQSENSAYEIDTESGGVLKEPEENVTDFFEYISLSDYKYSPEFTDIYYSDMRGNEIENSFVCYNADKSVLFYTGNENGFVYMKKDGKDTLILEKYVSWLQFADGELYFAMMNKGDKVKDLIKFNEKGKIYKYNIENDVMTCVYDKNVSWFKVTAAGIVFGVSEEKKITEGEFAGLFILDTKYYLLNKDNKIYEINENDMFTSVFNDKLIKIKQQDEDQVFDLCLYDLNNKIEEVLLNNTNYNPVSGYMKDDSYYFLDNRMNFHRVNLITKEYAVYKMEEYNDIVPYSHTDERGTYPNVIVDYTVINEDIYYCYGFTNKVIRLTKDGKCEIYAELDLEGFEIYFLDSFGDSLYVYSYVDYPINTPLKLDVIKT